MLFVEVVGTVYMIGRVLRSEEPETDVDPAGGTKDHAAGLHTSKHVSKQVRSMLSQKTLRLLKKNLSLLLRERP